VDRVSAFNTGRLLSLALVRPSPRVLLQEGVDLAQLIVDHAQEVLAHRAPPAARFADRRICETL
jgi:hypothetical protein